MDDVVNYSSNFINVVTWEIKIFNFLVVHLRNKIKALYVLVDYLSICDVNLDLNCHFDLVLLCRHTTNVNLNCNSDDFTDWAIAVWKIEDESMETNQDEIRVHVQTNSCNDYYNYLNFVVYNLRLDIYIGNSVVCCMFMVMVGFLVIWLSNSVQQKNMVIL